MSSGAGKKTLDVLGERHRHRIAVESKLRRKDTGKKQRKGLRGIGKERGLSTDCPGTRELLVAFLSSFFPSFLKRLIY